MRGHRFHPLIKDFRRVTSGYPDAPERGAMKEYYENPDVVADYSDARFLVKRPRTHRRESGIVDHFFRIIGRVDRVLDIPCGAGRFQKQLLGKAGALLEMDYSQAMTRKSRENFQKDRENDPARVRFSVGSILDIPCADKRSDVVFSMRIYHHFPDIGDRVNILRELKRAGRKWIILSFYNFWSYQHMRRLMKNARSRRQSRRYAITLRQFYREVEEAGLRVRCFRSNARFFSEQTVALLEIPD
jgi:SAM-dependent methyltransferase